MLKSLFLYYYSEKGYSGGLFFTIGYLASMFTLLFIGIAFFSEMVLDKGILSTLFKGSSSFGAGRGSAKLIGKLLGLGLILGLGAVLFVPSFFLYKKWTHDYDQMNWNDQVKVASKGKKVMNVFAVSVVLLSVGGVLIMIGNM